MLLVELVGLAHETINGRHDEGFGDSIGFGGSWETSLYGLERILAVSNADLEISLSTSIAGLYDRRADLLSACHQLEGRQAATKPLRLFTMQTVSGQHSKKPLAGLF